MSSAVDTLIDAAYATALDYRVSGAFIAAYHAVSESDLQASTLSGHIARAREIAASRTKSAELELPRLTISPKDGVVRSKNSIFDDILENTRRVSLSGMDDLLAPTSWKEIAAWISDSTIPSDTEVQAHASFVYKNGVRESAIVTVHPHQSLLDMVFLSHGIRTHDEDILLLQRMLGLTERQATVARYIAQGFSAAEIANLMAIKPHTVRDHTKAIYERTELNKQTDLAVLVGQLNLMAFKLSNRGWSLRQDDGSLRIRMTNFFWTKSGRRVTYSDCGDKNGRLILKVHATLGGRWICESTARTLAKYGLRMVIIERPGIAMTDHADGDRDAAILTDMFELLDHLNAKTVFGLSTGIGAFYLTEAIAAAPSRFSGACLIAPRVGKMPNIEPDIDTSLVESVGTLPMDAATLVLESAVNNTEFGGWEEPIRVVLQDSKVDLQALEDTDIMAMHVHQQRSATSKGVEGQAIELRNYKRSMPYPVLSSDIPISVVYGDDDQLVAKHGGGKAWAEILGIKPHIIKGAGQLLLLTHTRALLSAAGLISQG